MEAYQGLFASEVSVNRPRQLALEVRFRWGKLPAMLGALTKTNHGKKLHEALSL